MKSEYLITFDSTSNLCPNVDKFKTLLSSHNLIHFENHNGPVIVFDKKPFSCKIAQGKLPDSSIYYDLTIECSDIKDYEIFSTLLREIKKLCHNISGRNIITLHDGLGEEYCYQGYPIIFELETLMRKLISKFMAISVGYDWQDLTTPKEVLDSVRGESKNIKDDFLQEVDFIQLSNFLFKKYTKSDAYKFIDELKEKSNDETITIGEIKKYSPYTNWERYFSDKVDCESDFLKKRWEKLYMYRCKIAHCKGITKSELEDLIKTSKEVVEKINSALNSVQDIHIDASDREELAENLSSAINESIAIFISQYNKLSKLIRLICEVSSSKDDSYYKHRTNSTNIAMQANYLFKSKNLITKDTVDNIQSAQNFRNMIVHQVGISNIQENQIMKQINNIDDLIDYLITFSEEELTNLKGKDFSGQQTTKLSPV